MPNYRKAKGGRLQAVAATRDEEMNYYLVQSQESLIGIVKARITGVGYTEFVEKLGRCIKEHYVCDSVRIELIANELISADVGYTVILENISYIESGEMYSLPVSIERVEVY